MLNNEKIKQILNLLDDKYGIYPVCYLKYSKDYELLFATILSAQCTDERVNGVTKDLFKKYDTLEKFAEADIFDLELDIFKTGFYRNKAKNIKEAANQLIYEYRGRVPREMKNLINLAGVGRKTANLIRTHIFGEPSIVVDTHVKRVSARIGFTKETHPTKVEYDLMKVVPKENWSRINSQLIALGRTYCKAVKARCEECFLNDLCEKKGVKK